MKLVVNNSQRKVLIVWGIIAIILVVILILFKNDVIVLNKYKDKKYTIVNDESRYFTISTIVDRFYGYMNENNYKSVLNSLDRDYINSNNITEDNIFDIYPDKSVQYKSRMICKKGLDKGLVSYLVSGFERDDYYVSERLDNKYYEVILHESEMKFSIQPIDKERFVGDCHE